jgi:hypothetical protein
MSTFHFHKTTFWGGESRHIYTFTRSPCHSVVQFYKALGRAASSHEIPDECSY